MQDDAPVFGLGEGVVVDGGGRQRMMEDGRALLKIFNAEGMIYG